MTAHEWRVIVVRAWCEEGRVRARILVGDDGQAVRAVAAVDGVEAVARTVSDLVAELVPDNGEVDVTE